MFSVLQRGYHKMDLMGECLERGTETGQYREAAVLNNNERRKIGAALGRDPGRNVPACYSIQQRYTMDAL